MIIRICFFTEQGEKLAERLIAAWDELLPELRSKEEKLADWTKDCFERRLPILFIGASGIAVRAIAPFVSDKLLDSPVLVMDEQGQFVIPLLSGHMGGANELAQEIAKRISCTPVITTATDVEGLFSVDVFAKKNSLHIVNREGIRQVSAKLLKGEKIKICIDSDIEILEKQIPEELLVFSRDTATGEIKTVSDICAENIKAVNGICTENIKDNNIKNNNIKDNDIKNNNIKNDEYRFAVLIRRQQETINSKEKVNSKEKINSEEKIVYMGQTDEVGNSKTCLQASLVLETKEYVLGMGCKKDKSFEELKTMVSGIDCNKISAIASIDLKKKEKGLVGLAQYLKVPFITFDADTLSAVQGNFTESGFVQQVTGVSNVCERAAMCCAGEGGELILPKRAENGMTLAVAKCKPIIKYWKDDRSHE